MTEYTKKWYTQRVPGMGKRAGRRWTAGEVEYLQNNYGLVSDQWIARRLGRRTKSIRGKAADLGVRRADSFLTLSRVAQMMGVSYTAASRWVRQGLLASSRAKFVKCGSLGGTVGLYRIEEDGLLRFLREHPDQYDIHRIDREGYPHLYEAAREAGARRRRGEWSEMEEALLLRYAGQGLTLREIAEKLGRTHAGVACRLTKLRARRHLIPRKPNYSKGRRWTSADLDDLRELWGTLPHEQIARRLGRPLWSVRGKAKRLGLPTGKAWLAGSARAPEQEEQAA